MALGADEPPLVPVALGLAVFHATLAVLGFDVMRYVLRVVLPLSLVSTGVLVALYVASDDPRFSVGRVFESPDQQLTWIGFATYVTVMCGASLTLVTNVADLCRYTPTRRDIRIGLLASSVLAVAVTTLVGGYAAAATGELNPFIAVAELTRSAPLLVLLLAAIVVQGIAANITNVYTAGMSLVNAVPALGRLAATIAAAVTAIVLSAFPGVIEEAERWVAHLGNVAAPLTGVVLADYLLAKRQRIDVEALFDPAGRYRYVRGVNAAALVAVAAGIAAYSAVPQSWVKVVWGLVAGAVAYAALEPLQQTLLARSDRQSATTETA